VTATRLADAVGATLHVAHVAPAEDELTAAAGRRVEYETEIEEAVNPAGTTRPQRHVMFGVPLRIFTKYEIVHQDRLPLDSPRTPAE
jgi:hypothetical protein